MSKGKTKKKKVHRGDGNLITQSPVLWRKGMLTEPLGTLIYSVIKNIADERKIYNLQFSWGDFM